MENEVYANDDMEPVESCGPAARGECSVLSALRRDVCDVCAALCRFPGDGRSS